MSNTIDEKVVEMKFDNKNFETNVKTTMTSLDRLKEKLQLRGSEKSFQAIDSAAKSVSFDSLISNVEYLRKRFSVMGIAGMHHFPHQIADTGFSLFPMYLRQEKVWLSALFLS